jgi:hypothetical protein
LQVYNVKLAYRSGRECSRVYLPEEDSTEFELEVASVNMLDSLSIAAARLEEMKASVKKEVTMQKLKEVILKGWSER